MRIGILALVAIFFASGAKNIGDSRKNGKPKPGEAGAASRRKFGFGVILLVVGVLVLLYYFVSL